MLEEERKYEVGPLFTLPDLRAAAPRGGRVVEHPPLNLRATYHDTADLRLARNGASLRHRRGEPGPPWTLKLPSGEANVRREITAKGPASRIPEELIRLVLGYTRGAPLSAVASLATVRRSYRILNAAGGLVAEVVDDTVSVLDGRRVVSRFRELEVERGQGDRAALDRIEKVLVAAGAAAGGFTPKNVRALGPLAAEPPDLPPAQPLGHDPAAADVLIEELRREAARLVAADPVVRLAGAGTTDAPRPTGSSAAANPLEEFRLACRRLRTDLRVFSPLFAGTPYPNGNGRTPRSRLIGGRDLVEPLRDLAAALRRAMGPDVLRARLGAIEVSELDAEAAGRLDDVLADLATRARADLETLMTGPAYTRMLDGLVATARAPRLQDPAHARASEVLPALAATFWERLAHASDKLTPDSGPDDWRLTRRAARRLRRLSRLAVPVIGKPARRLVDALDPVVALLDVEREATRSADAWIAASEAAPHDRPLAITVGRLVEREHVLAISAREAFRAAWDEQKWRTATEWLV